MTTEFLSPLNIAFCLIVVGKESLLDRLMTMPLTMPLTLITNEQKRGTVSKGSFPMKCLALIQSIVFAWMEFLHNYGGKLVPSQPYWATRHQKRCFFPLCREGPMNSSGLLLYITFVR